jgi:hypothetical protein
LYAKGNTLTMQKLAHQRHATAVQDRRDIGRQRTGLRVYENRNVAFAPFAAHNLNEAIATGVA